MEIGLYTVLTDETMLPGEAAKLIEDAGFDAISVGEHSHIPSSRETPYPGGDLPDGYTRTLDLFVALTAAALATTQLRLESSIIQIAQRDPITTAKEAASLDYLSDGRLDLIAGHGWNIEEMRNHGVDPERRYDLVNERVRAIREIFQNDVATFHGEFVNFDAIWSWPKPVHPGGVPIIMGGNSPGSEERALAYGDGWAPINIGGGDRRARRGIHRCQPDRASARRRGSDRRQGDRGLRGGRYHARDPALGHAVPRRGRTRAGGAARRRRRGGGRVADVWAHERRGDGRTPTGGPRVIQPVSGAR